MRTAIIGVLVVALTSVASAQQAETFASSSCTSQKTASDEAASRQFRSSMAACGPEDVRCKAAAQDVFAQARHENGAQYGICLAEQQRDAVNTAYAAIPCTRQRDVADADALIVKLKAVKACHYNDLICQKQPDKAYDAQKSADGAAMGACLTAQQAKAAGPTVLKGGVNENVYKGSSPYDSYGKTVPPFTGSVKYAGVTLTVRSSQPMGIGQSLAGRVQVVAGPPKYRWAEGYLVRKDRFQITGLIDTSNHRVVLATPIEVPVYPK